MTFSELKRSWFFRFILLVAAVCVGAPLGNCAFQFLSQLDSYSKAPILQGNIALLVASLITFALLWWFRTVDTLDSNDTSDLSVYMPPLTNTDVKIRASGLVQIAFLKKRKPHLKEQVDSATANIDLEGETAVQLIGANLSKVNLEGANLAKVNLANANLTNANLTEAVLTNAKLSRANLTNANLTNASLLGADLREADLRGADLRRAKLMALDIAYRHIKGTSAESKRREAELKEAELRGEGVEYREAYANLAEAEADLTGATYSSTTQFPPDFDPEAAGMELRNE